MAAYAFAVYTFLETLIEDNDDLSDEDDMIHVVASILLKRETVPKIIGCVEKTVANFECWDFKHHFRINKSTFDIVADRVVPVLLAKRTENAGPIAVSPKKKLLVFLWYVSNTSSMREIANLFGLSKSTVHGIADVLCGLKDKCH